MSVGNTLLAALGPSELEGLRMRLEPVPLALKQTLHEPDRPVEHVYFVTSGVASMVNEPNPGQVVEFATIGREGMVGLPLLFGAKSMPSRAFVQVPGEALRMPASEFQDMLERHRPFRERLMRYGLALLIQVAQATSCNRLHEVQERCARWLLQTHDRVDGDSFPLTQEFLAQMLGVHRPTVSVAAGMLQRAGLIRYVRGTVTILDRKGLEAASCSCYGFIVMEYDRLLNREGPAVRSARTASP